MAPVVKELISISIVVRKGFYLNILNTDKSSLQNPGLYNCERELKNLTQV